jgi:flagellar assembly protein FliH
VIICHKEPDFQPKQDNDLPSETIEITEASVPEESELSPVIIDAEQQAETIINTAKEQAAIILADAQKSAEEIKSKAYDEAYKLGHEEGFNQGQEDGICQGKAIALEQVKTNIEESVRRAQQLIQAADDEATRMIAAAERQIIDLALVVTRKILRREIEDNPVITLPIVKAALDKVKDQDEITIRVSPLSYDFVLLGKQELQTTLLRECSLTIIADENLNEGDCIIETPYGTIDATIDSQLENLISSLQEIMP